MIPQAAARLLAAERARISARIDERIKSWEQFYEDYPEVEGTLLVISELDYFMRSVVNEGSRPQEEAYNPSG